MTDAADTAARTLLALLSERGETLAVAESLTGGQVLSTLVAVPGASAVLRGGVVAYATALKQSVLGVDAELLALHGAVHPDVARQMADGVRVLAGADVGIATTGVAGPEPQDGRAVGTVFIGISAGSVVHVEALCLRGSRGEIRTESTRRALESALAVVADESSRR
ncbi:CinA family protein [Microbacterium pygmaeum]|uniref:Nicotinamide-nucleotide amidase n=1 Tax=Microbacterium pygmaeum TaxID=370764 RepID=A0A1G8BW17_9MICO|nr:nicotinamide-nucleotide amidohydrolase family protein [Microbacterium pygmaeum]SDH37243.1 nicotinamide-nucleotide amidase [Microbacterium pygmaeum]